jgi:hypothetical protein
VNPPQEVVERVFGQRVALVQEVEVARVNSRDKLSHQPQATRVREDEPLRVNHLLLLEFIFFDLCCEGGLVVDLRGGGMRGKG